MSEYKEIPTDELGRISRELADENAGLHDAWLAADAQTLLAEVLHLRAEVAGYRSAICFETTCTGCAGLLDQLAQLEAERDQYRDLAEQLYQTDPCSFDHHGGCQEHLWLDLQPGEECPDGRAQRLFAKKDE